MQQSETNRVVSVSNSPDPRLEGVAGTFEQVALHANITTARCVTGHSIATRQTHILQ